MGMTIGVDAADAVALLDRVSRSVDDRRLLTTIGARHVKWIDDNLRGAGIEHPHQEMAESTIAARPRRTSSRHFSSRFRSRLAQSTTTAVSLTQVVVGIAHEHAELHHEGTRPAIIRPKRARMLAMHIDERGQLRAPKIFRKSVAHPGIPARPLLPSRNLAKDLASDVVLAEVRRATQERGRRG